MIISIIIPIYNVEKFLEKCILSCENQDIPKKEYEVICVNDGSPDSSAKIAEELAKQYSNIRIINQKNRGLSIARNTGLRNANGEYVWFVDSDDWIEENCLNRITSKLINKLDILQLQYRNVWLNPYVTKEFEPIFIKGVKTGVDITLEGGLPTPVPFCIYRRHFLLDNRLNFVPNIYHEDSEFKPRAVYLAKSIASDDVICYNYFQRQNGNIMSSFSLKRAKDILFVNERLYAFCKNIDLRCVTMFYKQISTNINMLLYGYRDLKDSEKMFVRKMLARHKLSFNCMIKSRNMKYVLEGVIFKINVHLGFMVHKILR